MKRDDPRAGQLARLWPRSIVWSFDSFPRTDEDQLPVLRRIDPGAGILVTLLGQCVHGSIFFYLVMLENGGVGWVSESNLQGAE